MSQGLTKEQLEEGTQFDPTYDSHGLITAVVTDLSNGDLLMVAHMNETALQLTLDTGIAHFWSRSRQKLWKKGESSGNFLHVCEIRTDCDQDAIWVKVSIEGAGATCHTGRKSCFYRRLVKDGDSTKLLMDETPPIFDPKKVYGE